MRCRRGVFFTNFGYFWGLGNTILTMGLVYLVPICSFSPNQKKKKKTKKKNKKKKKKIKKKKLKTKNISKLKELETEPKRNER